MPVRLFHEWKHLQTGFVIFVIFVDLQLVVIVQLVVVIQVLEELILFILFFQVIQVFEELEVGIKNKHDRNLRRTVISVYQVARCNYINIT